VQPIDARDSESAPRPCEDLNLMFTMDEREWKDGRVVVEISASGYGTIPDHTRVFDFEQEGFDVEVGDNGVSITEFVSDDGKLRPKADRNWQFTYARTKDLRGNALLHFPELRPGIEAASLEYQHYQDADLVDLDPKQAAVGVRLAGGVSTGIRNALIVLVLAALGLVAFLLFRRKSKEGQKTDSGIALPTQLTPFSVVAFLRRIQQENGSVLDSGSRQELQTEIRAIESAYFSGNVAPATKPDLQAVAHKWLRVAS